ncbi:MAG: hypothetical protein IPG12_03350 [Saprospiraceae bacterium]|nr:hypothetical protein [Saprospiraceae bacterium]
MKKIILCLCYVIFFSLSNGVFTQTKTANQINLPLGKQSVENKQWQSGNVFSGLKPQAEMLSARTEYTKKFQRKDGKIDVILGGPFHYLDNNGAWQDIDLSIKSQQDSEFKYINTENRFISHFAENPLLGVQMESKNNFISFGLNSNITADNWTHIANSKNLSVSVNNNIISYKHIYQGVNLEYEINTERIQHRLIFENASVFSGLTSQQYIEVNEVIKLPANSKLSDDLGVISVSRKTSGNIYVITSNDTLFTISPSKIWDATFIGDIDAAFIDTKGLIMISTFILILPNGDIKFISKIPTDWLLAKNRVYPLVLDPDFYLGGMTPPANYRYPFNTCKAQRISQLLYRNTDINSASGNITHIAFFRGPINDAKPLNNVIIKMQGFTDNSIIEPKHVSTGFTQVYGPGTPPDFISGTGWRDIDLTSDFPYDNTKNLLIEARFNNCPSFTPGCDCNMTSPGSLWGLIIPDTMHIDGLLVMIAQHHQLQVMFVTVLVVHH